jgi:hypothetical protein
MPRDVSASTEKKSMPAVTERWERMKSPGGQQLQPSYVRPRSTRIEAVLGVVDVVSYQLSKPAGIVSRLKAEATASSPSPLAWSTRDGVNRRRKGRWTRSLPSAKSSIQIVDLAPFTHIAYIPAGTDISSMATLKTNPGDRCVSCRSYHAALEATDELGYEKYS